MIIEVRAHPRARHSRIVETNGIYRVYITAPAVDGKANAAVIEQLAGHFNCSKSDISIIKGLKSRTKTISICKRI